MDLTQLIEISRFYGEGTDFVISGGGNTSVKDAERMAIKASGAALRGITEAGFVELARKPVRAILGRSYPEEPFAREARIKADLLASRTNPESGGRPSVEASLHESIEYRYVVHTHPFLVNALTSARDGEKQAARLFGDEALYLRYCDPGYTLAVHLHEALQGYRKAHGSDPHIVFMENHGLVVSADSVAEIRALTDGVVAKIRKHLKADLPAGELPVADAVTRVVPAIRMVLSEKGKAKVASVRNSALISHFLMPANREKVSLPFLPDHIVYCKSAPLFLGARARPARQPTPTRSLPSSPRRWRRTGKSGDIPRRSFSPTASG